LVWHGNVVGAWLGMTRHALGAPSLALTARLSPLQNRDGGLATNVACMARGSLPFVARESPVPTAEANALLVKVKLVRLGCPLDLTGVCLLQITLDDVVPVLAHRSQPSLLHDGRNDGPGKRVVAYN